MPSFTAQDSAGNRFLCLCARPDNRGIYVNGMLVLTLAGHRVRVTTRFDNLPSLGLLFLDVFISDTPSPEHRLR